MISEAVGNGWRRYRPAVLLALVILFGVALYTFRVTRNPAGFFVDESSVAYNAYTISQSGQDEFGNSWPLFFRAFGEYKNPVYIYLLAALFKLTGPCILTARLLGAIAGVVTAVLLGLLGARVSGRRDVGLLVAASALLTPWLFEVSRVAFEVSLYPLVVTLFLLFVQRAATKTKWSWFDVGCLASTLVLLTYTYSIGRLFAPLLALGLVFFATRQRWSGILRIWALYALSLVPMIVFQRRHPGALTTRFNVLTYVKPESSASEVVLAFLKHYAGNLDPRRLLVSGDPNVYQVAHVANTPALLAATLILVMIGAWFVVRHHRSDDWWRFVLYGLAVSIVPASLTVDYFHMLRLIPLLVFLILLTVPALERLSAIGRRRWPGAMLAVLIVLTLAQGAAFQWRYHISGDSPRRLHMFDANFPPVIFAPALATPSRPIYLADPVPTAYIQSYWYAVLNKTPISDFVLLRPDEAPPMGATVISTELGCYRSKVLAQTEPYTLYIVDREPRPRFPLPESAMRAEISVPYFSPSTVAGEKFRINVRIKNRGDTVWAGCERNAGPFQVSLGGRWLNSAGRAISGAEGRTVLPSDLAPDQETDLLFIINAPSQPGEYLLELDMLQEGVSWFKGKGSQPYSMRVTVIDD